MKYDQLLKQDFCSMFVQMLSWSCAFCYSSIHVVCYCSNIDYKLFMKLLCRVS